MKINKKIYEGGAGAIDEETFLTAFEDVPAVHLFSPRDLEDQMRSIKEIIGDDKKDWNQRTESVSRINLNTTENIIKKNLLFLLVTKIARYNNSRWNKSGHFHGSSKKYSKFNGRCMHGFEIASCQRSMYNLGISKPASQE